MPIGVAGIAFLVAVGVLLPWGAVRSARRLEAGAVFPQRRRFYLATLVQQLVMMGLALWAAHAHSLQLFPAPVPRVRDVLLACGLLLVLLLLLPWRWRTMTEAERSRLLPLLPCTTPERALYAVLAIVAGIGEELVYRGAMFALLAHLLGNVWVAAVLAAASFAVGHAVQGAATAAVVGLLALAFQGLAAVSGALYAGMTVHAVFDLAVGLFAGRILGASALDVARDRALPEHDEIEASVHQDQLPPDSGGEEISHS